MTPGNTIQVNSKNVEEIQKSINSLLKNKDFLAEKMEEYPLQIDFVGYRVTLTKNVELEQLIQLLQDKVCLYFENGKN